MTPKIDEKTVVPLGWVLTGFCVILGVAVTGAFWVSAVNFRLSRIEDRLGIPPYQAENPSPIPNTWAGQKGAEHVNGK